MRIAVVALTDFQEFPTGGILTFLTRFIGSVGAMSGVTLSLVGWKPGVTGDLSPRMVRIGRGDHKFIPVGEGRLRGTVPDRLQFYREDNGWKEALREVGDVDVFYCHSPESALRVARSESAAPIALHLHGAINTVGRSRFALGRFRPVMAVYERTVLAPAIRNAKAVFATVSDRDFNAFLRGSFAANGRLCQRIPAMVDIGSVGRRPQPTGKSLRLVSVGRVEPIKGIELLIRSAKRLLERGVPCELRVVGDGSQRLVLERQAARLGLGEVVTFLGALTQPEVHEVLAESDVYVSGSHQEGFSLALLEALSMGLPAVVTDVGSAREVVLEGHTGYVVNRRDPDLFAGYVAAASSGRWEMRERCEKIAEQYGSDRVSTDIVEALRRVAGQREQR
jgi:glycosyltransferase involved in cell wall biosynthesis